MKVENDLISRSALKEEICEDTQTKSRKNDLLGEARGTGNRDGQECDMRHVMKNVAYNMDCMEAGGLTMAEYIKKEDVLKEIESVAMWSRSYGELYEAVQDMKAADVAPVRHGYWILEAHKERVNCRWNVTSECSECCDEEKEIWAGFFPGVPDSMAREIALVDAEQVKLSNFCPNCGAKMDGDEKC